MTDMDKLTDLLNSWGVPHKPSDAYDEDSDNADSITSTVKVGGYTHQSDPRETVTGYNGFFTLFNFDKHGKFICMGAWE